MTAKAAWDNAAYWAITAQLYFQRRFRDPAFIESIGPLFRRFTVLHARMQQFFRAWDLRDDSTYADQAANVIDLAYLGDLQRSLADGPMSDDALRERLERNFALLERFASAWQRYAVASTPGLPAFVADAPPLDIQPLTFAPVTAPA
jgi:hypothetical protein